MSTSKTRFKMNQSLLSQWLYAMKLEGGHEKFVNYLNLKFEPPNKAMLDGTHFEGMVNAALNGQEIEPTHKWYKPIMTCKELLDGSQQQVDIYQDIEVDGISFLLHGILDFLKAGRIYDTKFSKTYHLNKYFSSPQTSMYFQLVPEAYKFTYVVCDGTYVYQEHYTPDQVEPIERFIKGFMIYLERFNLIDVYAKNWVAK